MIGTTESTDSNGIDSLQKALESVGTSMAGFSLPPEATLALNTMQKELTSPTPEITATHLKPAEMKGLRTAATSTANALVSSFDKLRNSDPLVRAQGVLDVMAAVSGFAVVAGPPGIIVAAVVGPLCIISSAILKHMASEEPNLKDQSRRILDDLYTEATRNMTVEWLRHDAHGQLEILWQRLFLVDDYIATLATLTSDKRVELLGYNESALEFLGRLSVYVCPPSQNARPWDPSLLSDAVESRNAAEQQIYLVQVYVTLAVLRRQLLIKISVLFDRFGDEEESRRYFELTEKAMKTDRQRLSWLIDGDPDLATRLVFAELYKLDSAQRGFFQGYFGRFSGMLCKVFTSNEDSWTMTSDKPKKDPRLHCLARRLKQKNAKAQYAEIQTKDFATKELCDSLYASLSDVEKKSHDRLWPRDEFFELCRAGKQLFCLFGIDDVSTIEGKCVLLFNVDKAAFVYLEVAEADTHFRIRYVGELMWPAKKKRAQVCNVRVGLKEPSEVSCQWVVMKDDKEHYIISHKADLWLSHRGDSEADFRRSHVNAMHLNRQIADFTWFIHEVQ